MDSTILNRLNAVIDSNCIRVRVDVDGAGINYPISVDVEHNEQGEMVCIGAYDRVTREAHIWTKITPFVKETLEQAKLIMHNGVTDLECLRSWGIDVKDYQLIWDTMLIGHILDSSLHDYGLKEMAKRELGIEYPSYEEIVGNHKGKTKDKPKCPQTEVGCCGRITLDKQPLEVKVKYNTCDCFVTDKIQQLQEKAIGALNV